MVVGPNGAGKSSIVCAVCLGLGGSPKILGRSDNLRSFVMHDKLEAYIEIELFDPPNPKNLVIRREFTKSANRSTWRLNDRAATEKEVKTKISALNVQVENLCTFLPQDKVGEFSSMNPQKILEETMKALGRGMLDKHLKLIAMQDSHSNDEGQAEKLEAEVKQITDELNSLEVQVRQLEEREKAVSLKQVLSVKKVGLRCEETKESARELQKEWQAKKAEMAEAKKVHEPLEARVKEANKQVGKHSEMRTKMVAKTRKLKGDMDVVVDAIEKCTVNAGVAVRSIDSCAKKLEREKEKLAAKREKLKSQEQELANLTPIEELNKEIAAMQPEAARIAAAIHNEEDKKQELDETHKACMRMCTSLSQEIQDLKDASKQRNNKFLQQVRDPNTRNGIRAVQSFIWEHSNQFQGKVLGPLALMVNVENPAHAACLWDAVSQWVWQTFIVQNEHDRELLLNKFSSQGWQFNCITEPRGPLGPVRGLPYSPQQLQELRSACDGDFNYLDELFTAPDPVRKVLRSQSSLDRQLYMGGSAMKVLADPRSNWLDEKVTPKDPNTGKKMGVSAYVVGKKGNSNIIESLRTTVSSYHSGPPTSVTRSIQLECPLMSSAGGDKLKLQQKTEALKKQEEKRDSARATVDAAGVALAELRKKKKALNVNRNNLRENVKKYRKLESLIKGTAAAIEKEAQRLAKAKDGGKAQHTKELAAALKDHCKCVAKLQSKVVQLARASANQHGATLTLKEAQDIVDALQVELKERSQAVKQLESDTNQLKQDLEVRKKQFKEFKALKELRIREYSGTIEELKVALEKVPQIDAEVTAAIEECNATIENVQQNPAAVARYEEVKQRCEEKTAALETLRKGAEEAASTLNSNKQSLRHDLSCAVEKLDKKFRDYMKDMGCNGEVQVMENERYSKWGMNIMVSFRTNEAENQLKALDANTHSGGERSVSTILYLMALQDLQLAPFRVVDEINQGMDMEFERKVFSRVVRNSCGPDRPQYFLITPKLLPGLVAMENVDVTVHVIMNGPWTIKGTKDNFDLKRFVAIGRERKRAMMDSEQPTSGQSARKKQRHQ
ncbi:unnamed protein product [Chrysoparadoxa australica]